MAICTQGSKLDQHAREGTILDLHGEPYKAPKSCCDSHRHHLLPRQGSPITPDGTVAGLQSDHGVRFRRGLRSAHVYVETKRSSPSNTEKLHILVVFIAQSSILGFESSLPKIKEKRRLVRAFTLKRCPKCGSPSLQSGVVNRTGGVIGPCRSTLNPPSSLI